MELHGASVSTSQKCVYVIVRRSQHLNSIRLASNGGITDELEKI
jgi:hypothetical protein